MSSISSYSSNFQDHQTDLTTQLSLRIKTLEQENRQLKQQLLWEDKLFANPNLSPGHKLALRAAVYTVHKADQPPDSLTKIFIPSIAAKIGLSPKTTGKSLQFLSDTGALIREAETGTDGNGQKITRVYIGLTDQIKKPETIQPSKPRNHGGLRSYCPSCGSENLIEEKKIICTDCGTVVSKTQRLVNPDPPDGGYSLVPPDGQDDLRYNEDETVQPADNLSLLKNQKEPMDNLTAGSEKPTTPPTQTGQETERELQQAALLILDIAGDTPEYIVMNTNPDIPKKYVTIQSRLTLTDMRKHLQGRRTLGATLRYQDGTTRALCFDADEPQSWQDLQSSAGDLYAAGYKPLLEPSPAGRGGHLWIIFADRVNAEAAYSQVVSIAPHLANVAEYWPSGRNQKVRLPAGRYVTPTFAAWTTLYDAARGENIKNSAGNVVALLANLTPATLIPEREPEVSAVPRKTQQPRMPSAQHHPASSQEPDEQHKRKYGEQHKMWVQWPDEQYLIDRFNNEHSIDDLATFERPGMVNASEIGRPERTASVGVTRDGQRFTDFGKGARQPDGSQDGGDPFEFYIRSQGIEKSEALRVLGRELNRAASAELLRAARAGEQPPQWIMEILTNTGVQIYNENAAQHGHPPLAEHGGVVGFSQPENTTQPQSLAPSYPPPNRVCIPCGVSAWQWDGEKYICANPAHPA